MPLNQTRKLHKTGKIKIKQWLCFSISLIFAIASFIIAKPSIAYAASAEELFRTAYENRYTWDKKFPGFSGEVSINHEGILDQGIVRISPDLEVEVINIDNENLRELITNQIRMEIIHRRRIPFAKAHENDTFQLAETEPSGAATIVEIGDKMNSYYQVKDNIITQVNRKLGDIAVTVDTLGTAKNPEGYLVTHFQTIFRDANTGEILEREDVRDFHEKIGRYYLLTNRTIRYAEKDNPEAKPTADTSIRINDIQPLN
ncbi:DUF3386 family protein [Oscillatoria salina]|uniref:DUF3386 family protein n=1 Tax=Oscillatoria salina TaxID=331517 RepID=UPI001CC99152|nr:DUF3386 family protein [Oscillatoria salina]MBZ8180961.1 DUF3386 family protein [Oscillatoria salina IIICB1]